MDFTFQKTIDFARKKDEIDPLKKFRREFYFPQTSEQKNFLYFCGNSLGLQPKKAASYIQAECDKWAQLGVEGHFAQDKPWYSYHEIVTESMSRIVGARPHEVVMMNSLTVNLHLMMVSFYTPTKDRYKILIEGGTFPSDIYAVKSQLAYHGFNPEEALIEMHPRKGEETLRTEDILQTIDQHGKDISLIMMSGVHFRTGQAYPLSKIVQAGHRAGCLVGFDLAHAAGNIELQLHDWNVDFAVWCSYKYLNAGPGGIGGCFVHERHTKEGKIKRPLFAGWWGHDKHQRFQMSEEFSPMPSAEAWQLSNPPIFQLASLNASLEIFDQAKMKNLVTKSQELTSYLIYLLKENLGEKISFLTPENLNERGCQISLKIPEQGKELTSKLHQKGVICDFRPPHIIRVAPAPLYNSFMDVYQLVQILEELV